MNLSVAGIAYKNGKYLMALRKPGTSIGERWEFPGGKVEPGESEEEALKREFLEELHIHVLVGSHVGGGAFSNNGTAYCLEGYYVTLLSETFVLTEHQSARWFSLEEMRRLPMADSDRQLIECLSGRNPTRFP